MFDSSSTRYLSQVCERLLVEGLISPQHDHELWNRHAKEADRVARLVELLQQKVKQNPQNYLKMISVLESGGHSNLQKTLIKAMSSQGNEIDMLVIARLWLSSLV